MQRPTLSTAWAKKGVEATLNKKDCEPGYTKTWNLEMSQGWTCFNLHRSESFLDFSLVAVVGSGTLFSWPGQLKVLCFTTGYFPTLLQTYIIILVSGIIFKIPALVDLWTQILHVRILGGMGAHGQVLFAYCAQDTHANKKLGHSFFKGTIGTGLRSQDCAWGHDLRKSASRGI